MTMRNEGLTKTFDAGAAIAKCRILKFGEGPGLVVQATGATDNVIGVSDPIGAESGKSVDVILEGIATVEYGGNVTAGDLLMADADGKAILATHGGGAHSRLIGVAMVSGVSGDLGAVHINTGSFHA